MKADLRARTRTSTAKNAAMRLREIVDPDAVTIGPKMTTSVALANMRRRGIRHLLVAQNGNPLGILSERHSIGGQGAGSIHPRGMVQKDGTTYPASVESTAKLERAFHLMRKRKVSCVLITDEGKPIGTVTASDLFHALGNDPIRAPLPGWRAKEVKREMDADKRVVPAHIRVLGVDLDSEKRKSIRQQLGASLGKFRSAIERVSVRVEDVNGPRGGIDQVCRIKVVLSDLPSVVFEDRNASLDAAIGGSLAGVAQAVRRSLQRRRMKPIRTGLRSGLPAEV